MKTSVKEIINKYEEQEWFNSDSRLGLRAQGACESEGNINSVRLLLDVARKINPAPTEFISELEEYLASCEEEKVQESSQDKKYFQEGKTDSPIEAPVPQVTSYKEIKSYIIPTGTELEIHPEADEYPMQTDEELAGLCEDINSNGVRIPILILQGKILDGRNRYKACMTLGLPIPAKEVDIAEDDVKDYALSLNLSRRHLNSGQRAVMALRDWGEVEKKSEERMLGKRPCGKNSTGGKTIEILAKRYQTNSKYIQWAKEIQDKKPELLDDIFNKRKNISNVHAALKSKSSSAPRNMPKVNIPVFVFQKLIEAQSRNKKEVEELMPHMPKYAQDIVQRVLGKRG